MVEQSSQHSGQSAGPASANKTSVEVKSVETKPRKLTQRPTAETRKQEDLTNTRRVRVMPDGVSHISVGAGCGKPHYAYDDVLVRLDEEGNEVEVGLVECDECDQYLNELGWDNALVRDKK